MKLSKKNLMTALIIAFVGMFLCVNGCKKSTPTAQAKTIELCTHCGQIKGCDLCCKPGQPKCPNCGLVKGSAGCCKIPKT